jgi:hypothetical protein
VYICISVSWIFSSCTSLPLSLYSRSHSSLFPLFPGFPHLESTYSSSTLSCTLVVMLIIPAASH